MSNRRRKRTVRVFPEDFLWGATLTAHAVEGEDVHSDWWAWEQRPGRIAAGATSQEGAGHLKHWKQDLALSAKLKLNALQIGLSWVRIEPEPGQYDIEALTHYAEVFAETARLGLAAYAVLFEDAAPAWFTRGGGWQADASESFARFAVTVAEALGSTCRGYIPILEPMQWVEEYIIQGIGPAGSGSALGVPLRARAVRRNLLRAEAAALQALRSAAPEAELVISRSLPCRVPEDSYSVWDYRTCKRAEAVLGAALLPACGLFDAICLGWRGASRMRFAPLRFMAGSGAPTAEDVPALELLAEKLAPWLAQDKPVTLRWHAPRGEEEPMRRRRLLDVAAALAPVAEGAANLHGFFYDPLLDGFEGAKGYDAAAGLVHVRRPGFSRTPQPTAFILGDIAESGGFRRGPLERWCPDWRIPGEENEEV